MSSELVPLALIAGGTALGLFCNRKARLFTIPALMLYGVTLGQGGLGALPDNPFLHQVTDLGLILMLFFTSLFGNPRALKEGGGAGLPLAAYDLLLNFAVAWWIGTYFGFGFQDKLFLAGIMATSSTAVVMKILADEGRITRREGNVLISLLMIEDWVFLGFYGFLGLRFGVDAPRGGWLLVIGLAGFLAFLLLLRMSRNFVWRIQQREVLICVLTGLGIMGAWLGTLAGLPGVGSAFTTGLALSGSRGAQFSQREAPYLREAASAVFFVGYGALLGPSLSLSLLPLVAFSLGGIVLTEVLMLPLLARRLGLSRMESFLTGANLLARGGKSAAFAKLYPAVGGTRPLFGLAGILAVILTPVTPALVKFGLWIGVGPRRAAYADPSESFSRSARGLLMPHAFHQRSSATLWNRVALGELVVLAALLGLLTLLVPMPYRAAVAALAGACLVILMVELRRIVRRAPGLAHAAHPRRMPEGHNPAFQHLPLLLTGPLAFVVLLALGAGWSLVAYPILVGSLFLCALLLPWVRPRTRRAPALARALASSASVTRP